MLLLAAYCATTCALAVHQWHQGQATSASSHEAARAEGPAPPPRPVPVTCLAGLVGLGQRPCSAAGHGHTWAACWPLLLFLLRLLRFRTLSQAPRGLLPYALSLSVLDCWARSCAAQAPGSSQLLPYGMHSLLCLLLDAVCSLVRRGEGWGGGGPGMAGRPDGKP